MSSAIDYSPSGKSMIHGIKHWSIDYHKKLWDGNKPAVCIQKISWSWCHFIKDFKWKEFTRTLLLTCAFNASNRKYYNTGHFTAGIQLNHFCIFMLKEFLFEILDRCFNLSMLKALDSFSHSLIFYSVFTNFQRFHFQIHRAFPSDSHPRV